MDDVEYAKLNHKKRRGKPQKTKPYLEDPTTIVYADIKTSHIQLPVEDPKPEKTERRFKCRNITKILILIILILSCALAFFISYSVHKQVGEPSTGNTTNSVYKQDEKLSIGNTTKSNCYTELSIMEIKRQLCGNITGNSAGCTLCPSGWLRHNENCYNISSGGEYRTWKESREVCEEMGAHLLVIEDREQQEFINRSVKQQTDGRFWMGLYRDGDGDGWRWVDGQHYDISLLQRSGSSGDCVWLGASSEYNKDRCTSKHNWICQKKSLKI